MARINVEESLFVDLRYKKLVRLCNGNEREAVGMCVLFWRAAQQAWTREQHIPKELFVEEGFGPLLEAGLASEDENGVYANGSEQHFEWLMTAAERGKMGGIKSGEARRSNREANAKLMRSKAKHPPSNEPSSSSSSSSSSSLSKKELGKEKKNQEQATLRVDEEPAVPVPSLGSNVLISVYCDAYKARYKARPVIDGKMQGEVRRLLKHMPLKTATDLVQVYLQIDDKWFVTKHHDFTTLMQNLNKVSTALQTGLAESRTDWSALWSKIDEKEGEHATN